MTSPEPATFFYEVFEHQQEDLLFHLLDKLGQPKQILIYARKREDVQQISTRLSVLGLQVDSLHGKKKPAAKALIIKTFLDGHLPIIVTTEASTRDLDLTANVIINYDLPELPIDFTKRQQSAHSLYLTFVTPLQKNSFIKLENTLGVTFEKTIAEHFNYDTKSIKTTGKCKKQNKSSGPRSKPLQHKKPKLRPKTKR